MLFTNQIVMFGLYATARKASSTLRSSSLRLVAKASPQRTPFPKWPIATLLLLAVFILFGKYWMSQKDLPPGLVPTEDGQYTLSPERQAKLDRELEEIDNAIQYALVASADGFYPCYSCVNGQKTIFLKFGEVWKYGVTRKGAEGRYPQENYGAPNLVFIRQLIGTYSECLKAEKTMIYGYPLLPEAQGRDFILIRPPGNKYDS